MASRLTVIISQSAVRQNHLAEIEESLLTELMLAAGMDATLIGPLNNVRLDSTDCLCLSSFTQSVALVSDLSTAEVTEQWQRLQLQGQVVPLGSAAPAESRRLPAGRRIYHLPMSLGTAAIVKQLRQLLADKEVQTVSVSLPLPAKSAGNSAGNPAGNSAGSLPVVSRPAQRPTVLTATTRQANGRSPSAGTGSAGTGSAGTGAAGTGAAAETSSSSETEWPDLDRLVDDFDSLDL